MRIAVTTREWPPEVYGGAGVHVTELVKAMQPYADVDVYCMGAPRDDARAFALSSDPDVNPALKVVQTDVEIAIAMAASAADVAHSHTWYAVLAGHLGASVKGIPHVVTAHSLEPHRPWKAEQLGGGYTVSSWVEREAYRAAAAVVAVSTSTRADVLDVYPFIDPDKVHVIYNGIDTAKFAPVHDEDTLRRLGVDPSRPFVLFVGRITRQKGLAHLVAAAHHFPKGVQVVLAASSPDEPGIGAEVANGIAALSEARPGDVVWLNSNVARPDLLVLLSHAAVFLCPSVYEPLGIVNLEAMACNTPVVASAVGGIPEVVVDGTTGLLVPYTPDDVEGFRRHFAEKVGELVNDPTRARAMGDAGRARAVADFGWDAIARQTIALYDSVRS